METFLLKLAVAVIPLIFLVAFVPLASTASRQQIRRPMARHRRHCHVLRALAHGTLLY